MKKILVQQKVSKAIDGKFPTNLTEVQNEEEYEELVYISIILHLSDTVLRKIGKLDYIKELWQKLDNLYLIKYTP